MSYYWFNRQELLQKAKEKYSNGGKEKAAKYYQANKDVINKNQMISMRIFQKKKKKERGNNPRIDTTK